VIGLLLPAAAERAIDLDERLELPELGLCQRELRRKEPGFAIEDLEVAGRASPVAQVRQPGRVFRGTRQLLLLEPDLVALAIADERVGDLAKRLLHGALVDERGLFRPGFGKADAIADP